MRYSQAFYPTWDEAYAERLREEFGLDARAVIRTLSKGQRARAGLLVALAYRPELLVLDEPSSGLDPIVRRDVLAAVIRTLAVEGRSVLFSSHLLSEVEQIADRVAMIHGGRVAFCETLDDLKESHARLTLRFPVPRAAPPRLDGALAWQGAGREWTVLCAGSPQQWEAATASLGAQIVQRGAPTLDEIFVARARSGREAP
jgi:ABC-2 type transport system ATP-binding protein